MCRVERDATKWYSPELITVAKTCFKPAFDHDVCVNEVTGEIKYDGTKVRIVVNKRDRWIQVGCTRITFLAMKALADLCVSPDETVIQE